LATKNRGSYPLFCFRRISTGKDFGKASSGKSIIIASTEGNVSIPEKDDIKIGLNVYKKV
jgi:hypothetical protein